MTDTDKLDGIRRIMGGQAVVLSILALIFWLVSLPDASGYYDAAAGTSSAPMLAGLCLIGAVMAFVAMVGVWWMTPSEDDRPAAETIAEPAAVEA